MKTLVKKYFWRALGAGAVALLASLVVLFLLFPKTFQYIDLRLGFSFPLYGIERHSQENIQYLERNHCDSYREECHCVIFLHGVGESAHSWGSLLKTKSSEWFYPVKLVSLNIPEATYLAIQGVQKPLKEVSEQYQNLSLNKCSTTNLVGNSLGGMIAARMVIDNQSSYNSLTLINAAGIEGDYSFVKGVLNSSKASDFEDFFQKTYHSPPPLPKFFWKIVEKFVWLKRSDALIFPNDQIPDLIPAQDYAHLKVPSLIIWGKEDRVLPDLARKYQKHIPDSEVNYIEQCAHVPQKECPQAVLKSLKRLIERIR